jgi:hypothetical protein
VRFAVDFLLLLKQDAKSLKSAVGRLLRFPLPRSPVAALVAGSSLGWACAGAARALKAVRGILSGALVSRGADLIFCAALPAAFGAASCVSAKALSPVFTAVLERVRMADFSPVPAAFVVFSCFDLEWVGSVWGCGLICFPADEDLRFFLNSFFTTEENCPDLRCILQQLRIILECKEKSIATEKGAAAFVAAKMHRQQPRRSIQVRETAQSTAQSTLLAHSLPKASTTARVLQLPISEGV